MTTDKNFHLVKDLDFSSKVDGSKITISKDILLEATQRANLYLRKLSQMFEELNFDVYDTLGQRNLSGFIGEVFSNSLEKLTTNLEVNPHGDGRPDLLDFHNQLSRDYFQKECIEEVDGRIIPKRSNLAPYKFGGIEVKSSIGSPVNNYKDLLYRDRGKRNFEIGVPRIDYLNTITYWGHHQSCENLLGLYYDYYESADCVPQILALMHSELNKNEDWHNVSVGKEGSKKTSNTSLTNSGKSKLFKNIKIVIDDKKYTDKLRNIGLTF